MNHPIDFFVHLSLPIFSFRLLVCLFSVSVCNESPDRFVCPFVVACSSWLLVCLFSVSVCNESPDRFVCPFVVACFLFPDYLSVCLVYPFTMNHPVDLFIWLSLPVFFPQLLLCLLSLSACNESPDRFVCRCLFSFSWLLVWLFSVSVCNESPDRFVCPFVVACFLFPDYLSVCLVYPFAMNHPIDLFVRLSLPVFFFLLTCPSV